jgi:hypothetical protein
MSTRSRTISPSARAQNSRIDVVSAGPLVYVPKLMVKIPSAKVAPDEHGREHGVYSVEVTRIIDESKAPVVSKLPRKFSHFRAFHESWCKVYPELGKNYELPPKVWIGNRTPEVMETRRQALETYLSSLLQINCLVNFLGEFLQIDPDVIKREMKEKRECQNRAELEKLKSCRRVFDEEKIVPAAGPKNVLLVPNSPASKQGPELPPIPAKFLKRKASDDESDAASLVSSRKSSVATSSVVSSINE